MKESFYLDEDQLKKLDEWLKTNPQVFRGVIGGSLTYSFTPTSLGVVAKVKNTASGKEIDLTDYESW